MRKTTPAPDPDLLLTVAEVAAILRVGAPALRKWRFNGVGPKSFKIGSRTVYKKSDVDRWVAENYAKAVGGSAVA